MASLSEHDAVWFTAFYERHVNTVYRVCRTYLHNSADTEDATQDVFLKVLTQSPEFTSVEHEKAWLIRVAINRCKDLLKSGWSKRLDLESIPEPVAPDDDPVDAYDSTLELVLGLPENQRSCVLLYYYEGYNTAEIADFLKKPHSTVRNYLSDARKTLREKLGSDFNE